MKTILTALLFACNLAIAQSQTSVTNPYYEFRKQCTIQNSKNIIIKEKSYPCGTYTENATQDWTEESEQIKTLILQDKLYGHLSETEVDRLFEQIKQKNFENQYSIINLCLLSNNSTSREFKFNMTNIFKHKATSLNNHSYKNKVQCKSLSHIKTSNF